MTIGQLAKAAWKDAVWSKVIATALVAAISAIAIYLLSLWPVVRGWMLVGWAWATTKTAISNWLLLLMVAASICLAFAIVGRFVSIRRISTSVAPRALSDVETQIMRWLAKTSDEYSYLQHIASSLKINKIAAEHAVDELVKMAFVHRTYFGDGQTACYLAELGRAYVVKQGYTN